MDDDTKAACQILKKRSPTIWRAIADRRYSLADKVVPEYTQQQPDQEESFMHLWATRRAWMLEKKQCDAITQAEYLAVSQWLKYGAQVYFLERDMGEARVRTPHLARSLNLRGCHQLSGDLSPLTSLTSLQSLNLEGCGFSGDLSPLACLTSLQSLGLDQCTSTIWLRLGRFVGKHRNAL
jgi:hypothetical protein